MNEIVPYMITAILGGGMFKGIESVYRAITDSKEKRTLAEAVGARTPAEIESVAVTTMTSALESAQTRIVALQAEREADRQYFQGRISTLEAQKQQDQEYYLARILELTEQLQHMRQEMEVMERSLAALLAETNPKEKGGGN